MRDSSRTALMDGILSTLWCGILWPPDNGNNRHFCHGTPPGMLCEVHIWNMSSKEMEFDTVLLQGHKIQWLFTSRGTSWRKFLVLHVTALCPVSQRHVYEAPVQAWEPGAEPKVSELQQRQINPKGRERERERGRGAAVCLMQFSDLPPRRWLPLFAHSVNYYQKAVYLGGSPMLLHILWPFIKEDLHYKPWSPSN